MIYTRWEIGLISKPSLKRNWTKCWQLRLGLHSETKFLYSKLYRRIVVRKIVLGNHVLDTNYIPGLWIYFWAINLPSVTCTGWYKHWYKLHYITDMQSKLILYPTVNEIAIISSWLAKLIVWLFLSLDLNWLQGRCCSSGYLDSSIREELCSPGLGF